MKKGKIAALAVAGTLTATALLAGTYAWTSISQRAVNEATGEVNPGGRLHDDFNGENKDIYVENFTSPENGATIYARIRLDEYLEIGGDSIVDTAVKENLSTWEIFKLENENNSMFRHYFKWVWGDDVTEQKTYLPTFNKNKDSLEADINGTLAGREDTDVAYDDYVDYATIPSKTSIEIYDADKDVTNEDEIDEYNNLYLNEALIAALDNGSGVIGTNFAGTYSAIPVAEGEKITLPFTYKIDTDFNGIPDTDTTKDIEVTVTKVTKDDAGTITEVELDLDDYLAAEEKDKDGADIKVVANVEHETKTTQQTAKVISMLEWKALPEEQKQGKYWVYDKDGWAYWAEGIAPGQATGCLLTGIERTGSIVDEYYYGINVTAEFATAGDWGDGEVDTKGGTGFFENSISTDGLLLLNTIAGAEKDLFIELPDTYESAVGVTPGASIELGATVKLGATIVSGDEVRWSLDGATDSEIVYKTETTAELVVGENEQAEIVTVKAELVSAPDEVFTSIPVIIGKVYELTVNEVSDLAAENVHSTKLTATITDQRGKEKQGEEITWSLVNTTYAGEQPVTIEGDVLTITDEVEAGTIAVRATAMDGAIEDEGDIPVKSQLEYIASVAEDRTPGQQPIVKVDGVVWYMLRKQDVSGDGVADALLWATAPVDGWLRGAQAKDNSWVGWSYYNKNNPFAYAGDVESGKENRWKYSNLRTWLNSTGEETGKEMDYDSDGKPYWVSEEKTITYPGFLNGKSILANNAVPTDIYTRTEWNTTGESEGDFEKSEGDKVFVFSQADIYGTSTRVELDESGQPVKNDDGTDKVENDYDIPVEKDYTVDAELYKELTPAMRKADETNEKWHILRSPNSGADSISIVYINGAVGRTHYVDTGAYIRPALWLELPASLN